MHYCIGIRRQPPVQNLLQGNLSSSNSNGAAAVSDYASLTFLRGSVSCKSTSLTTRPLPGSICSLKTWHISTSTTNERSYLIRKRTSNAAMKEKLATTFSEKAWFTDCSVFCCPVIYQTIMIASFQAVSPTRTVVCVMGTRASWANTDEPGSRSGHRMNAFAAVRGDRTMMHLLPSYYGHMFTISTHKQKCMPKWFFPHSWWRTSVYGVDNVTLTI